MEREDIGAAEITRRLQEWSAGDEQALEELVPMILGELKRRAGAYLRQERIGHTLQPTALVNEVYLRLVDQKSASWKDRSHFFAVAAQLMRRILVDHARSHRAEKRGGKVEQIQIDEAFDVGESQDVDLVALDDALTDLAKLDARQSKIVELRFFGGLTIDETAETLRMSSATVTREWRNARAWLIRQLGRS